MPRIPELPKWTGEVPSNTQIPVEISGVTYYIESAIGNSVPIVLEKNEDSSFLKIYENEVLIGQAAISSGIDPTTNQILFYQKSAGSFEQKNLNPVNSTFIVIDSSGNVNSIPFSQYATTGNTLAHYGITDAQAYSTALTSIAGLSISSDRMLYTTGPGSYSSTPFTPFARTLVDDADASAMRLTLGISDDIGVPWGYISGNISGQTDLQIALSGKQNSNAKLSGIASLTLENDRGIFASGSSSFGTYVLNAGGRSFGALAGVTNTIPYFSSTNVASSTTFTPFARTILEKGTSEEVRELLQIEDSISWGGISGNLNSQIDLATALSGKQPFIDFPANSFGARGSSGPYSYKGITDNILAFVSDPNISYNASVQTLTNIFENDGWAISPTSLTFYDKNNNSVTNLRRNAGTTPYYTTNIELPQVDGTLALLSDIIINVEWGNIGGVLSDQSDLISVLNEKQAKIDFQQNTFGARDGTGIYEAHSITDNALDFLSSPYPYIGAMSFGFFDGSAGGWSINTAGISWDDGAGGNGTSLFWDQNAGIISLSLPSTSGKIALVSEIDNLSGIINTSLSGKQNNINFTANQFGARASTGVYEAKPLTDEALEFLAANNFNFNGGIGSVSGHFKVGPSSNVGLRWSTSQGFIDFYNNTSSTTSTLSEASTSNRSWVLPDADGTLALTSQLQPSINSQTGTSYSLQLSDIGKIIKFSNSSAVTVTLPDQSSVTWPSDAQFTLLQAGTGLVTLQRQSTGTINGLTSVSMQGRYKGMSLLRDSSNVWIAVGAAE